MQVQKNLIHLPQGENGTGKKNFVFYFLFLYFAHFLLTKLTDKWKGALFLYFILPFMLEQLFCPLLFHTEDFYNFYFRLHFLLKSYTQN